MLTKPQTLGAGDYLARDEIAVKTLTVAQQATGLTASADDQSGANFLGVGRVLTVDQSNLRGAAAGDRAGLSGVISDLGDLATYALPTTVAEGRRRCGVILNQGVIPGNPAVLQIAGPTRVLASDTGANLVVGAPVTISTAANNSRGTVRLAAIVATPNQEEVVGTILDPPRNSAGAATDGTVAAPRFCVVDFFGLGRINGNMM